MQKTRFNFDRSFMDVPNVYGKLSLLQIGRRYCSEGEVISTHTHQDFFELTIVNGGEGVVISNNTLVSKIKNTDYTKPSLTALTAACTLSLTHIFCKIEQT